MVKIIIEISGKSLSVTLEELIALKAELNAMSLPIVEVVDERMAFRLDMNDCIEEGKYKGVWFSFSIRTSNCFENAGLKTVGDLIKHSPGDLLRIKNFGRKSLNETRELLANIGLVLKNDTPPVFSKRYNVVVPPQPPTVTTTTNPLPRIDIHSLSEETLRNAKLSQYVPGIKGLGL